MPFLSSGEERTSIFLKSHNGNGIQLLPSLEAEAGGRVCDPVMKEDHNLAYVYVRHA